MLAVIPRCFEQKLGLCLAAICDAGPHAAWRQTRHGNGLMLAQRRRRCANNSLTLGQRLEFDRRDDRWREQNAHTQN